MPFSVFLFVFSPVLLLSLYRGRNEHTVNNRDAFIANEEEEEEKKLK